MKPVQDAGHLPPAVDPAGIRAIVLDVAESATAHEAQDALTDFVWHALERGYQIYLASSTAPQALEDEDFQHPRLKFLTAPLPPGRELLQSHPDLGAAHTLWVTDHPGVQAWIRERGLPFAFLELQVTALAPGLPLGGYPALAALLDPSAATLNRIAAQVGQARARKPHGPLLVGIGGPPGSNIAQLAVQLKSTLERDAMALVELLDLSPHLAASDAALSTPSTAGAAPWRDAAAGAWLMEHVLGPLSSGQRLYIESRPAQAPPGFDAHYPLFIAEDAVVLVLGEMLFVPPIRALLDVALVVEVSPTETTRRVYEMPVGETFDPEFTKLYMAREGHRYWNYLQEHHVLEQADIRIDGDLPQALRVLDGPPRMN